jgi:hypothetical protein
MNMKIIFIIVGGILAWFGTFSNGQPPNAVEINSEDGGLSSYVFEQDPGLVIHGRVLQGCDGLPNVEIYLSFAAYPGELVAITDGNGYFKSDFIYIPDDEMVGVWAKLAGSSFEPENFSWRHNSGYELRTLRFVATGTAPSGNCYYLPLIFQRYFTLIPPCLSQPGPLITLSGNQIERFNKRWDPLAENTKIDAHTATWTAQWPVQDQFNNPVRFAGGPSICFSGGTIQGNYPEQIGSDSHSTWEYMHSTTGLEVYADNTTIEGTRIHNYGDGIDYNYGPFSNFIIKGVHLSYIRDDCVQNDYLYSGLIEDSLFDGCYSAFSARTYTGQDPPAKDGSNNLWTIRNSLIRLEPMWGVYENRGLIPGHDGWFKWDSSGISPRLALHNNIFRVDQDANNVGLGIPSGKLESCSNNIVVWLGSGPYPDPLPTTFKNQPCFTITTDPSVWDNAVAAWLSNY